VSETIQLGDVVIAVTRKAVKHVYLSVHPPAGHVTLVAPTGTRLEVARAYAVTRLGWIRRQQAKLQAQPRETPRQYIERESHYLWGRRYLLSVVEKDAKPAVKLDHRRITLSVRPGSTLMKREEVLVRMASRPAACGRTRTHQAVGGKAGRHGHRLLPPAHED
jgi:predicted metal-dependent hydrolase